MGLGPTFAWLIFTICSLGILMGVVMVVAWMRSRAMYAACIFVPGLFAMSQPPASILTFRETRLFCFG